MVFHDGDSIMINHAVKKASEIIGPEQQIYSILFDVSLIRPKNFLV